MKIGNGQRKRDRGSSAFTLIEIMIVMAIIMIIMATGVPSIVRGMEKDQLSRAVKDTIEGCKTARDRAILQGIPWAFVLNVDREFLVEPMPGDSAKRTRSGQVAPAPAALPNDSPYSGFPRKLGDTVKFKEAFVNFAEPGQESAIRVRFFPNGTSDEFTIGYELGKKERYVKVDVVTGLATEITTP